MTDPQALGLGVLQGATELFPVSSLGHAVVVPALLRWDVDAAGDVFVSFLVLLHVATALALLILYRHQWARIARGFVQAGVRGEIRSPDERLAMLLAVGTVPAAVIGVLFERSLKSLFATPRLAGSFLMVNGLILLGAEALRRREERRARLEHRSRAEQEASFGEVERLGFATAVLVGASQVLAFLPGIPRSGVTMAAGLVGGLRHEEALRFSFLLATPVIGAAGLVSIPDLFGRGLPLGVYAAAAALAGVAAYLSARFLVRYFRVGRLTPYAYYCGALGVVGLVLAR